MVCRFDSGTPFPAIRPNIRNKEKKDMKRDHVYRTFSIRYYRCLIRDGTDTKEEIFNLVEGPKSPKRAAKCIKQYYDEDVLAVIETGTFYETRMIQKQFFYDHSLSAE